MKSLFLGLLAFGLTTQVIPQEVALPEVEIAHVNYKYLNTVETEDSDLKVKSLEDYVSRYDITRTDFYDDEYDTYTVSFFIPEGQVVAAYDAEGNLLRTIERFKNIKLPRAISLALTEKFPAWKLDKDAYRVIYNSDKLFAGKIYKMKLTKGGKTIKVKTNENGNFL